MGETLFYVFDFFSECLKKPVITLFLLFQVVSSAELSDSQKSVICEALAVNDGRLLDGASEYLQVVDLCTVMMKQMNAVQAV